MPAEAALGRNPNFLRYVGAQFLGTLNYQTLNVAVGWQIYDLTHRAIDLGYVGLAQFLPSLVFALAAGHVADHFERVHVFRLGLLLQACCAAAFLLVAVAGLRQVWPLYLILMLFGTVRAFAGPAQRAMIPLLVGQAQFARAAALGSSTFQLGAVLGPAIGGLAYGFGAQAAYGLCTALLALAAVIAMPLRTRPQARLADETGMVRRLLAGLSYIFSRPIVLGAVSLDLFAVLLGGATALLPIYARDIFGVGPAGLGLLRSAPAAGAVAMSLYLAWRPITRHAGAMLLKAVVVFGLGTIVFGLSTNFWLSMAALALLGAADMISIVLRQNLVQFATPDAMRGRVMAVELVFVNSSNQLGEFESGLTAAWFGTVPAVLIGGIGTLVIVGLWAVLFPSLRKVDRPNEVLPAALPAG